MNAPASSNLPIATPPRRLVRMVGTAPSTRNVRTAAVRRDYLLIMMKLKTTSSDAHTTSSVTRDTLPLLNWKVLLQLLIPRRMFPLPSYTGSTNGWKMNDTMALNPTSNGLLRPFNTTQPITYTSNRHLPSRLKLDGMNSSVAVSARTGETLCNDTTALGTLARNVTHSHGKPGSSLLPGESS